MPASPTTISRPNWQSWRYDPADLKLRFHINQVKSHEIDLTAGDTSADVLDSTFDVQTKNWATPAILDGLGIALKDCLAPATNDRAGRSERAEPLTGDALRRAVAANIANADRVRDDGVRFRR
jgi:hypothetical protein